MGNRMILRACQYRRFHVLDLLRFCGYALYDDEETLVDIDTLVLGALRVDDFLPIEQLCGLGFSLRSFADRNRTEFHTFVQSLMEQGARLCDHNSAEASTSNRQNAFPAIRRLAKLDGSALEMYFRSVTFLEFVGTLLSRRSFVVLRQIVEVHPDAFSAYFRENHAALDSLLADAFQLRDISLIVDMTSLRFPMGPFFLRRRSEVDLVLLNTWFQSKRWTELLTLKTEVKQWSFPSFFERSRYRSDDFVLEIINDGYWFDFTNLLSCLLILSVFSIDALALCLQRC